MSMFTRATELRLIKILHCIYAHGWKHTRYGVKAICNVCIFQSRSFTPSVKDYKSGAYCLHRGPRCISCHWRGGEFESGHEPLVYFIPPPPRFLSMALLGCRGKITIEKKIFKESNVLNASTVRWLTDQPLSLKYTTSTKKKKYW